MSKTYPKQRFMFLISFFKNYICTRDIYVDFQGRIYIRPDAVKGLTTASLSNIYGLQQNSTIVRTTVCNSFL